MSYQQGKATSPICVNGLIRKERKYKKKNEEEKKIQVTPMEFLGLGNAFLSMQLKTTVLIENKRLVLCGHQM